MLKSNAECLAGQRRPALSSPRCGFRPGYICEAGTTEEAEYVMNKCQTKHPSELEPRSMKPARGAVVKGDMSKFGRRSIVM